MADWRNSHHLAAKITWLISQSPSQFWIDVRYTSSTIQLFQSETQVEPWVSQSAGDEYDFLTSNEIGFRS